MLRDRRDLEEELIRYIDNKGGDKARDAQKMRNEWSWELLNKYNIPLAISKDIMSLSKDLSEYDIHILYAVTEVICPDWIKLYFVDREIKTYSIYRYNRNEVKFPIDFDMIQVNDDQYIGVTSAQVLMKLREYQYINYNPETQRALEIMINGGKQIFRPYVSYRNVNEIEGLYERREFIPNTITLNINMDDEQADWVYYEQDKVLRVNNISAFDIADGYHRYLGMSRAYMKDNNFDYPMELRITNFSVSKAQHFMFQEDHNTKMKKVNVEALNQYDNGNMVVKRINTDPESYLCGKVEINGGIISPGVMGVIINKCYFNTKHKFDRAEVNRVANQLIKKLNNLTTYYPEYLDRKWSNPEINLIVYGLAKDISIDEIVTINRNLPPDLSRKLENYSLKALKEVFGNV